MFADLTYNYVRDPINELFDLAAPALVNIGFILFNSVAGLLFIVYLCVFSSAFDAVIRFVFRYFVRLVFGNLVLEYYDKPLPIPGLNLSFHQLPSEICDTIVSYFDMKRFDVMLALFQKILQASQIPGADLLLKPVQWTADFIVYMYDSILWVPMALSYQAVGVITVILPLFVFTLLIPGISSMFWNCLSAIWEAAFYRVTAAAIVFCASTSTLSFIANDMQGHYSFASFITTLPKLCALMLSWVASFFVIGHLTSDIWKGSSHGSGGFGNFVSRRVR